MSSKFKLLSVALVLLAAVGQHSSTALADDACGDGVTCPDGSVVQYDIYSNCYEHAANPGTCIMDTSSTTATCDFWINSSTGYDYCTLGSSSGIKNYPCKWQLSIPDGSGWYQADEVVYA